MKDERFTEEHRASVEKKIAAHLAYAKKYGIAGLRYKSNKVSSLSKVITTKAQADAFMKQLNSL